MSDKKKTGCLYVKKPRNWTFEDLNNAVSELKQFGGHASYRQSQDKYNLSVTTLRKGIFLKESGLEINADNYGQKKTGLTTILGDANELLLADIIRRIVRSGFPCLLSDIPKYVCAWIRLAPETRRVKQWKDDLPGWFWTHSFMKRHSLSLKKPASMSIGRFKATTNPFVVYDYYDTLEGLVAELNLAGKPHRVFNTDETCFCHDPSKARVVGIRGEKTIRAVCGSGKLNTTVLATICADGSALPPHVIHQGIDVRASWLGTTAESRGVTVNATADGWITAVVFTAYFDEVMLPWIRAKDQGDEPAILIYDGHSTHVTVSLLESAREANVHILRLPPHTTETLQPLDAAVFGPLKSHWEKKITDYTRWVAGAKAIDKSTFVDILCEAWPLGFTDQNVKASFEKTGTFPVEKDLYVGKDRIDPKLLDEYKDWLADGKPVVDGLPDTPMYSCHMKAPNKDAGDIDTDNSDQVGSAAAPMIAPDDGLPHDRDSVPDHIDVISTDQSSSSTAAGARAAVAAPDTGSSPTDVQQVDPPSTCPKPSSSAPVRRSPRKLASSVERPSDTLITPPSARPYFASRHSSAGRVSRQSSVSSRASSPGRSIPPKPSCTPEPGFEYVLCWAQVPIRRDGADMLLAVDQCSQDSGRRSSKSQVPAARPVNYVVKPQKPGSLVVTTDDFLAVQKEHERKKKEKEEKKAAAAAKREARKKEKELKQAEKELKKAEKELKLAGKQVPTTAPPPKSKTVTAQPRAKKPRKRLEEVHSSSSEVTEYSSGGSESEHSVAESMTEIECDIRNIAIRTNLTDRGQFVAVYFDEAYYWGQIQGVRTNPDDGTTSTLDLNYLIPDSTAASRFPIYKWPAKPDRDPSVDINVVFWGPVEAELATGAGSGTRERYQFLCDDDASARYRVLRRAGGPRNA